MKWLADLLDRFLDRIAPIPDFSGPDWLTDEEADREDWLADELTDEQRIQELLAEHESFLRELFRS